MRILGKIIKFALGSMVRLAAVAVIFCIGFGLRLAAGPVETSVPQALLDRVVAEAAPGWHVQASGAVIDFSSDDGISGLKLRDVVLSDTAGTEVVSVPVLGLRFKLSASLNPSEILSVREVALSGASLDVVRDENGAFRLAIGDVTEMGNERDPFASLSDLGEMGDLPRLRIEDAQVRYTDLARGSTWQTEKARLTLSPGDEGLAASMDVVIDGGIGGAQLEAFHTTKTGDVTATLTLNDVRPSRVARLDPILAPLARIDSPLRGEVKFLAHDGGTFHRVSGHITAAQGHFVLSDDPLPFDTFAAGVDCDFSVEACEISDLAINASAFRIKASGSLRQTDPETATVALTVVQAMARDGETRVNAGRSSVNATINTQTGYVVMDQAGLTDVSVSGLPDGYSVALSSASGSGRYDPQNGTLSLPGIMVQDVILTDAGGVRQSAKSVFADIGFDQVARRLTISGSEVADLVLSAEGADVSVANTKAQGIVDLAGDTVNLSAFDAAGVIVKADDADITLASVQTVGAFDMTAQTLSVSGLQAAGLTVSTAHAGVSVGRIDGAATVDIPAQRIYLSPTTLTETLIAQPTAPQSRVSVMGMSGTIDVLRESFTDADAWVRDAVVAIPDLYVDPVHLGEAQMRFAVNRAGGAAHLDVQQLTAMINGLNAQASGQFSMRADKTLVGSVSSNLGPVNLADLPRHWPLGVAPGGLRWIADSVKSGVADTVTVTARFDEALPDTDVLDLRFGFRDAVVSFLPEMPPIQNATGSGQVTLDRVDVGLTSGNVYTRDAGPLALSGSSFAISDFSPDIPLGEVSVRAEGDVKAVLRLLDTEPLGVVSPTGFDIAATTGQADVRVHLILPLSDNVNIDDVRFDARAKVHEYSLTEPQTDMKIDGDLLQVKATPDGMTLQSDARIGGLGARLGYQQGFNRSVPGEPESTLTLESYLSLSDFARHGLVLDEYVEGLTAMKARIEMFDGGATRINADADLTNLTLKINRIGWQKARGVPATVRLSGFRNPNGVGRIEALELRGDGLSADGSIGFEADGNVTRANFSRIVLGSAVDTSLVYGRKTSGNVGVLLKGALLDLRSAFAAAVEGESVQSGPRRGGPDTDIRVEMGRVFLRDDLGVFDLKGGIRLRGGQLHAANVAGRLNGSAPAKLLAERRADGMALRLTSPDAGAFIRATDVFTGAYDGALRVDAVTRDTVVPAQISGRILATDMVLHDAPTLGRILSGGAISSLMSDLKNGGIKFSKIELPFQGIGPRWQITEGVAFGPQIGLTLDGGYDVAQGRLALNGSVSPAYAINGALGNIPLLGKLLTGGEGEGVFGVTFSVDGHTNKPVVRVNALSALTPGFLRKIVAEVGKDKDRGLQ